MINSYPHLENRQKIKKGKYPVYSAEREINIQRYSWSLLVLIFCFPLFSMLDYIVYKDLFWIFLSIRVGLSIFYTPLFIFLEKVKPRYLKLYPYLMFMPATSSISLMCYLSGDGFSSLYYGGILLIIMGISIVLDFSLNGFFFVSIFNLFFHFTLNSFAERFEIGGLMSNIFAIGSGHLVGALLNYITNDIKNKQIEASRKNEYMVKVFSHDVKNRLTLSTLYLDEVLINIRKETGLLEKLSEVKIEQDRVSQMIKNLINCFSTEGQIVLNKRTTHTAFIVSDIKNEWAYKFKTRNTELVIIDNIQNEIQIDYEYMKLAWNNLITNSLQNSKKGGRAQLTLFMDEKGNVNFSFMNSGIVIPVNFRKQIFDKYLNPDQHSPYSKGLGLHYTKLIAKLHGGDIKYIPHESNTAETEYNEFVIKIPA